MEGNKEIVRWLSHMSLDSSCATVPNITLEKNQQQLVDNKQQVMETLSIQRTEDQNLHLFRGAVDETSAENIALSKEVSNLLNKLQINHQTLPNDVKDSLKNVSAVLKTEGLSDVDETALIISMDRRKIFNKKQQRIKRELKVKYKELLHRHSVLERKLNYLKENVSLMRNSIEKNQVEYKNEYSNYKLLTAKLVEYNETASTIETDIEDLNLNELEPEKILNKYKKFVENKGQLAELNQTLKPYGDLPPNLLQAKALLESKELEYKKINENFLNTLTN